MVKYVSALLLIGLASTILCGFIVVGQTSHAVDHNSFDSIEYHFSMWSDISTALVSDVSTYNVALISILVPAYFVVRNVVLSLPNIQLAYDRIPIKSDKGLGKQSKLIRWLSLFENSPSLA